MASAPAESQVPRDESSDVGRGRDPGSSGHCGLGSTGARQSHLVARDRNSQWRAPSESLLGLLRVHPDRPRALHAGRGRARPLQRPAAHLVASGRPRSVVYDGHVPGVRPVYHCIGRLGREERVRMDQAGERAGVGVADGSGLLLLPRSDVAWWQVPPQRHLHGASQPGEPQAFRRGKT